MNFLMFKRLLLSFLVVLCLPSAGLAQVNDIDRRVAVCSAGLSTSIDGELKGKIGEAYEESDVVGDNFVLEQLGSIFKGATASERIELFKIYTECLKSERENAGSTGPDYNEPTEADMLKAHSGRVSPIALRMFPITRFSKQGCSSAGAEGYECSYGIVAGGSGSPKLVTNVFAKIGSEWIMRVE